MMLVLVAVWVLVLVLVLAAAAADGGGGGGVVVDAGLVSRWMQHVLKVDPIDPYYPQRSLYWCGARDWLRETNASLIWKKRRENAEFVEIESQLNRCARPGFFPRTLTTNQISWRSRPRQDQTRTANNETTNPLQQAGLGNCTTGNPGSDANSTLVSGAGICVNGTWVPLRAVNQTAPQKTADNDPKRANEVVHRFLAFAILLPQHPFSSDLLESLRLVTPLYPHVAVVIGSAHDFAEFSTQYTVRSYPKLLFFAQGLLKHKFKGNFNPWELAAQFSLWTNTLPRALPDPGPPFKWILPTTVNNGPYQQLYSQLNRTAAGYYSNSHKATSPSLAVRFWHMLSSRSFEPFVGASDSLAAHDIKITALAATFVATRVVYRLFS